MISTHPQQIEPLALGERDAAKLIGVCPRSLFSLRRQGRIAAIKIGHAGGKGRVLYPLAELRRFVTENAQTAIA
jgi:hypothetical protein